MGNQSSRRSFLQISATAASALTLRPLVGGAADQQAQNPTVRAFEEKMLKARPVALGKVRILGGPLKTAQDLTAAYLLSLDPDRMMAYYRIRAGLQQKAEPYGGWDGSGKQLSGHIAGHHLSAVSLMFQATGDTRFKDRADYLIKEMKEVQDKHGDGYLGANSTGDNISGKEIFARISKGGEIRAAAFDLNGLWSPWYTLHKTFAGLRDAFRHTGNKTALDLEVKFAKWAEQTLAPLSDAQIQRMLGTEFGGMNEVLVDLYADTGDKRWLDLSYKFEHRAFTDALKRHHDNLNGKHGNCQIPKLIGSAARYTYIGDPQDIMAASFFYDRVVQHHTYATGGHGLAEYFGAPDVLSTRVDGRVAETCNVYNMLKLTRRLFALRPDPYYADFQEKALFNHILASIDNTDGRTSYMVPVGRGVQQEYQNMQQSFTCCVGSGMESHALHGDGLYYESPDTIFVNLFVPSSAQFTTAGVQLKMDTTFPDGDAARITLTMPSSKAFTLAVRRPAWAGDGFAVKVNGTLVDQPALSSFRVGGAGGRNLPGAEMAQQPSVYVELNRAWKSGDVIELSLPKSLRLEPTPDNKSVAAILWGPLVLAGNHGPRRDGRGTAGFVAAGPLQIPALVAANRPIAEWLKPAATSGDFTATGVAQVIDRLTDDPPPQDLLLTPFYRTHRRVYSVYFDVITQAELESRRATIAAARARTARLERATIAFVQPGDANAEKTLNYQSDPANRPAPRAGGRSGRGGPGWFSYDIAVDGTKDMALIVTYFNEQGQMPAAGNFQILADNASIGVFESNETATGFWEAQYLIPPKVTTGKTKVTVKFQSNTNGNIAPIFGIRMVRMADVR